MLSQSGEEQQSLAAPPARFPGKRSGCLLAVQRGCSIAQMSHHNIVDKLKSY